MEDRIDPPLNRYLSSRKACFQPFPDKREYMNDLSCRLKVVQQIFREHFASIYHQQERDGRCKNMQDSDREREREREMKEVQAFCNL